LIYYIVVRTQQFTSEGYYGRLISHCLIPLEMIAACLLSLLNECTM